MDPAALDYVAILVPDIKAALPLFQEALGGRFLTGGDDHHRGIRTLQLTYAGGGRVEQLMPLRPDSEAARRLEKHGPGCTT